MSLLGALAKDKITGFTGIVVSETNWLNGCKRVQLQPRELTKDGGVQQAEAFDIEQIEVLKKKEVETMRPSGGPMPNPVRR